MITNSMKLMADSVAQSFIDDFVQAMYDKAAGEAEKKGIKKRQKTWKCLSNLEAREVLARIAKSIKPKSLVSKGPSQQKKTDDVMIATLDTFDLMSKVLRDSSTGFGRISVSLRRCEHIRRMLAKGATSISICRGWQSYLIDRDPKSGLDREAVVDDYLERCLRDRHGAKEVAAWLP